MFDDIFFPHTARKYWAAPLAEQRERYLTHLQATGAKRATLRKCANDQLNLVRLLELRGGERVSRSRIKAAGELWARPKGRRCDRAATAKTRDRFVNHSVRWLVFLGWLDDGDDGRHPHHAEVEAFGRWSREERGLSDATVQSYCKAADHFFRRLADTGVRLSAVGMNDIDDAVAAEHARGAWRRRTRHDYAQRLRAFFLFAETRGWCRPGC